MITDALCQANELFFFKNAKDHGMTKLIISTAVIIAGVYGYEFSSGLVQGTQ